MKDSSVIFCNLRHGVKLTVWNTSKHMNIRAVGDFLAKALEHFKHHRDVLKTDRYTAGNYSGPAMAGRRVLGSIQLMCRNEEGLTAALWTDVVISAYSSVNTVEQMLEELPVWQKAVEKEDGYLREVVGMLEKPGGDLLAMAAMIKHRLPA